jgi:hypothetical protein
MAGSGQMAFRCAVNDLLQHSPAHARSPEPKGAALPEPGFPQHRNSFLIQDRRRLSKRAEAGESKSWRRDSYSAWQAEFVK